jgi:hypothetical protein
MQTKEIELVVYAVVAIKREHVQNTLVEYKQPWTYRINNQKEMEIRANKKISCNLLRTNYPNAWAAQQPRKAQVYQRRIGRHLTTSYSRSCPSG